MIHYFRKFLQLVIPLMVVLICRCSSRYDRLRQELSENRAKWQQREIATYSYRFSRYCFCLSSYAGPFRIFVVDNRVDSIYSYTEERPISDSLDEFSTIDGLFDILSSEIDRDPPDMYAEFDQEYNFPTKVRIDNIAMAIDDETGFDVDSFVVQ